MKKNLFLKKEKKKSSTVSTHPKRMHWQSILLSTLQIIVILSLLVSSAQPLQTVNAKAQVSGENKQTETEAKGANSLFLSQLSEIDFEPLRLKTVHWFENSWSWVVSVANSRLLLQETACQADGENNLVVAVGETCYLDAGDYTFNNVTIEGTVEAKGNTTTDRGVKIQANTFAISTSGVLTANGEGFPSAQGEGRGTDGGFYCGSGGGGYGGIGGNGCAAGGISYGDKYFPSRLGSAGGETYTSRNGAGFEGGSGGGAISLEVVGNLNIDGSITANGSNGDPSWDCAPTGGGAGGSVLIRASSVTGSGIITVNGGDRATGICAGYPTSGAGAGGRVAIYATSIGAGIQNNTSAIGGSGSTTSQTGFIYLGEIDPLNSTISVDPSNPVVDNTTGATVLVRLLDINGVPVPSQPVSIAVATGSSIVINGQQANVNEWIAIGETDNNGYVSSVITASLSGLRTIAAQSAPIQLSQMAIVTFIPTAIDNTASELYKSGDAPADGETTSTITVIAKDIYGNRIPDIPVTLQVTGSADLSQASGTTLPDGTFTTTITDTEVETVTVSAYLDNQLVPVTTEINFLGGELAVTQTVQSPASAVVTAGYPIQFRIQVANTGLLPAEEVRVTNHLPANFSFESASDESCQPGENQEVVCVFDLLPARTTVVFDLTARVDSTTQAGTYTNGITVTTISDKVSVPEDMSTLDVQVVAPQTALTVNPNPAALGVVVGESASLTLTILNSGTATATGLYFSAEEFTDDWVFWSTTGALLDLEPGESTSVTLFAQPTLLNQVGTDTYSVTIGGDGLTDQSIDIRIDVLAATAATRSLKIAAKIGNLQLLPDGSSVLVDSGIAVTEDGSVSLVSMGNSSLRFSGEMNPNNGETVLENVPLGEYFYRVVSTGYKSASGYLTVSAGSETQPQIEIILLKPDPFKYEWHVTPVGTSYTITLYITYEGVPVTTQPVWCQPDDCVWNSGSGSATWSSSNFTSPSAGAALPPPIFNYEHVIEGEVAQQLQLGFSQNVLLEGEAFLASLNFSNVSTLPLTDFTVNISIQDEQQNDRSSDFNIDPGVPTGPEEIGAAESNLKEWWIVPALAAEIDPAGERFMVSASITYLWNGIAQQIQTLPEWITIYPSPELSITYQASSRLCEKFDLKVIIDNNGDGAARDLRFRTAQPIAHTPLPNVEPVPFKIISTTVNGVNVGNKTDLELGDLAPGEQVIIVWRLLAEYAGHITDFQAEFEQNDPIGLPTPPLISQVTPQLLDIPCTAQDGFELALQDSNAAMCSALEGSQARVGGPINTRTGGVDYSAIDLVVLTDTLPITFQRWYSTPAADTYQAPFGYGWTHSLDSSLEFAGDTVEPDGIVLVKLDSTNRYTFTKNTDGTYTAMPGFFASLTKIEGENNLVSYQLIDPAQQWIYTFAANGRLQSILNDKGKGLLYIYDDPTGFILQKVQSTDGSAYMAFTYLDNRLQSIQDQTGERVVSYTYDADRNLATVSDVADGNNIWQYRYEDLRFPHFLTQVLDPLGHTVERTQYDSIGRAVAQYDGLSQLMLSLTYGGGTTTVKDAFGKATIYTYNSQAQVTKTIFPDGSYQSQTYDEDYHLQTFTDENGEIISYTWSDVCSAPATITEPLDKVTQMTYNPDSHTLATLTDARGTLYTYAYTDLDNRFSPSSVTVAAAGETQARTLMTYAFNSSGLLEAVTDALDHTTSYSYNASNQVDLITNALQQSTQYRYDDLNRLQQVEYSNGRVDWTCYNLRDQVARVVANASGDGATPETDPCDGAHYQPSTNSDQDLIVDYSYDPAGRMIAETQVLLEPAPIGLIQRTNRTYYNDNNLPVFIVRNLVGQAISVDQPPTQNLTTEQNLVTAYRYDKANRPIAIIDPRGVITRIYYDNRNRPIYQVNNLKNWDIDNGILPSTNLRTNLENVLTSFTYDKAGRQIATTVYPDNTTSITTRTYYDAAGRPEYVVENLTGQGIQVDTPPDETARTATENLTTRYTYDAMDNLIAMEDPLGTITRTYYNEVNQPTFVVENLVNWSIFTSSPPPVEDRTEEENITTEAVYDPAGRLIGQVDALGIQHATYYDDLGRPTLQVRNLVGPDLGDSLGANNALLPARDPLHPDQNVRASLVYDAMGNVTDATDPNNVVKHFEYDLLGRLTAVVENYHPGFTPTTEINVRTEYTYDKSSNLRTLRDANAVLLGTQTVTTYQYDPLNRLQSQQDPLVYDPSYTYDEIGNLKTLTDANGQVTSYGYDELGRLESIDYVNSGEPGVTFVYDAIGRRKQMSDGWGTTTWEYDNLHRVTSVTDPANQAIAYGYDAGGNLESLTYPDLNTAHYTYDPLGRLDTVTDWQSQVTDYGYNAGSRLTSVDLPNGVGSSYAYDALGRLTDLTHSYTGNALSGYHYGYDYNGNQVRAEELLQPRGPAAAAPVAPAQLAATEQGFDAITLTWQDTNSEENETVLERSTDGIHWQEVDTLDRDTVRTIDEGLARHTLYWYRLTARNSQGSAQSATVQAETQFDPVSYSPAEAVAGKRITAYQYDALGRLTDADEDTGLFYHYTYDAAGNRLSAQTLLNTTNYGYDAANRLTTVNGVETYQWDANGSLLSDGATGYTYDAAGRLKTAARGSNRFSFDYNGLGERYRQTADGVATDYVLELNLGLSQVLSDGTHDYLYGLERIAQYDLTGVSYYLGDAQGSVRQLVGGSGDVLQSQDYDPFGNRVSSEGDSISAYGYAGEWTDASGLVNLRARYYDPTSGRFTSRDPVAGLVSLPATLNGYNYAVNNPLRYSDPSGRFIPALVGAAAIGAVIGAGFEIGMQLYQMQPTSWEQAIQCINWKRVLIAAGVGAVSGLIGAVGGLVLGESLGAVALTGAFDGMITGQFARYLDLALSGRLDQASTVLFQPQDILFDTFLGGLTSTVGYGVGRIMKGAGSCNSFSAETEVATSQGEKPISQIQIGDQVLAYNTVTDSTGYYTVDGLISHEDPVVIELTLDDETLTTTLEHPFYTLESGWQKVSQLEPGEHVRKADGSYGVVQSVVVVDDPQRMYNLSVDQAHSFFVGEEEWLVHNARICNWLGGGPTQDPEGLALVDKAQMYSQKLPYRKYGPITVAVSEVNGETWVAINRSASPDAVNKLKQLVAENGHSWVDIDFTVHPKDPAGHAEWRMHDQFPDAKIGINNGTGPCPGGCKPHFIKIGFLNVYYPYK